MNKSKVISINFDSITFDNNTILTYHHDQDCCENHYLSFSDLILSDFDGLEFDLTSDNFFERIEGYGIELKPFKGFPIRIPGYGNNNGYYSSNLEIVLSNEDNNFLKVFDISKCQEI